MPDGKVSPRHSQETRVPPREQHHTSYVSIGGASHRKRIHISSAAMYHSHVMLKNEQVCNIAQTPRMGQKCRFKAIATPLHCTREPQNSIASVGRSRSTRFMKISSHIPSTRNDPIAAGTGSTARPTAHTYVYELKLEQCVLMKRIICPMQGIASNLVVVDPVGLDLVRYGRWSNHSRNFQGGPLRRFWGVSRPVIRTIRPWDQSFRVPRTLEGSQPERCPRQAVC